MVDHLEVWDRGGPRLVALEGDRLTIGSSPVNHVAIDGDPTVSRLHAVLERVGPVWCVRDVGSRNGTFLNRKAVRGDRRLGPHDELRMGRTRLVFRGRTPLPFGRDRTEGSLAPPRLTGRERDVLVALCTPLLAGSFFTAPASVGEIAEAMVVGEPAIRQHLVRLYDKFAIHGGERRLRLANEAISRGAVSLTDLHPSERT